LTPLVRRLTTKNTHSRTPRSPAERALTVPQHSRLFPLIGKLHFLLIRHCANSQASLL
jgi:hypothetical protein